MCAPIDFTGERYLPTLTGQIKYEHLHRYAVASQLVAGRDVLDLACGEGYGADLLARRTASVVGVDNSPEVISYASKKYTRANLYFLLGSCHAVPMLPASVDLVVSFETIEHHDKHEEMMQEVRRVLRPGGLLVISTPDRQTYSDKSGYKNPFYVKEVYYHEFRSLLKKHVRHVQIFGQRLAIASFVHAVDNTPCEKWIAYAGDSEQLVQGTGRLLSPLYFVALCSDEERNMESSTFNSVYLDHKDDVLKQIEGEVGQQMAETRPPLHCDMTRLNREREAQENALVQQRHALELMTRNLDAIHDSNGWKALRVITEFETRSCLRAGLGGALLHSCGESRPVSWFHCPSAAGMISSKRWTC
jgi:ubiquinone/menaquinone biosynthesis C-methylase UbiE